MRKLLFIIIFLIVSNYSFAMSQDLNAGLEAGRAVGAQSAPVNAINNFNPAGMFEHYSENASESQYYQDGDLKNTDKMERAAVNQLNSDQNAKIVVESVYSRPQYTINRSTELASSQTIKNEADKILHGVTSQYVDCKPKEICKISYQEKSCEIASLGENNQCSQNLVVNATMPAPVYASLKISFSSHSKKFWIKRQVTTIDLISGAIKSTTGNISNYQQNIKLNLEDLKGQTLSFISLDNARTTVILEQPSKINHYTVKVGHSNGAVGMSYQYQLPITPIIDESWHNECVNYERLTQQGICHKTQEVCETGPEVRTINGFTVSKQCWKKRINYQCEQTLSTPCGSDVKACEQIGSICTKKIGELCLTYEQTYRCPINKCTNTPNVICGDGKDYCLDGDCVSKKYEGSKDFSRAANGLSAANAAAKSFDGLSVFKGNVQKCGDDVLGFNNCCRDSGWGHDVNLASCNNDEKSLGAARQKKLAIYVGRYCSHKTFFGNCTAHKKVFCVFDSKLARLVQEQGRHAQLGKNFGSAKNPNCSGISPQDLQKINFDKIDFGAELINSIKIPDAARASQLIEHHIESLELGEPNA